MARPTDEKIEQCLRKLVRRAFDKDNSGVTVKQIRAQAEAKLHLGERFFLSESWKERSKAIIQSAFEDAQKPETASEEGKASHPPEAAESAGKKRNIDGEDSAATVRDVRKATEKQKSTSKEAQAGVGRIEKSQESLPPTSNTVIPAVNGVKRKTGEASEPSSGSSGSSSDEDSGDGANDTVPSTPKSKKQKNNFGVESSAQLNIDHQSSPASTAVLPRRFEPPHGYNQIQISSSDTALSEPSLRGKQIWHITAPSHVSLTSLTEITQSSMRSRAPILSHKGVDYILSEATETPDAANTHVLLPTTAGYHRIEQKIERVLRISQNITLPTFSTQQTSYGAGSNAAADIARAAVTSVRPQPKGLRMRYRPPGFGSGQLGRIGSDSESSDEDSERTSRTGAQTLQFPQARGAYGTKVANGGDIEMPDVGEKGQDKDSRKKKDKTLKKQKMVNGVADSPRVNKESDIDRTLEKNGKSKVIASLANGEEAEAESKDEKARRKEERRARKEEKRKARAQSSE